MAKPVRRSLRGLTRGSAGLYRRLRTHDECVEILSPEGDVLAVYEDSRNGIHHYNTGHAPEWGCCPGVNGHGDAVGWWRHLSRYLEYHSRPRDNWSIRSLAVRVRAYQMIPKPEGWNQDDDPQLWALWGLWEGSLRSLLEGAAGQDVGQSTENLLLWSHGIARAICARLVEPHHLVEVFEQITRELASVLARIKRDGELANDLDGVGLESLESGVFSSEPYLETRWTDDMIRLLAEARKQSGLSPQQVGERIEESAHRVRLIELCHNGDRVSLTMFFEYALACGYVPTTVSLIPIAEARRRALEERTES